MKQISKNQKEKGKVGNYVEYPKNLKVILAIPTSGKTTLMEQREGPHVKFFDNDDFWEASVRDHLGRLEGDHKHTYLIGSFIKMLDAAFKYAIENPQSQVFALTNLWYRETTSNYRYDFAFLRDGQTIHNLSKKRSLSGRGHKVIDMTTANSWAEAAKQYYVELADKVFLLDSNEFLMDAFVDLNLLND